MNRTYRFEMFRYITDEKPREITAWFSDEKIPNPRGPQIEESGRVRFTNNHCQEENGSFMDVSADVGHGIKVIYPTEDMVR